MTPHIPSRLESLKMRRKRKEKGTLSTLATTILWSERIRNFCLKAFLLSGSWRLCIGIIISYTDQPCGYAEAVPNIRAGNQRGQKTTLVIHSALFPCSLQLQVSSTCSAYFSRLRCPAFAPRCDRVLLEYSDYHILWFKTWFLSSRKPFFLKAFRTEVYYMVIGESVRIWHWQLNSTCNYSVVPR